MYLTKEEIKTIEAALSVPELVGCSAETMQKLIDADTILLKAYKKQKEASLKTWEYIKKKRETDKNYCRPKKA